MSALNQKGKGSKPGNFPKSNAILEIGEHSIEKNTFTIAEARVQSQVSSRVICGVQSGTGTGLSPSTFVSPVSIVPLDLHANFQL
jgi:hypothetical protein